MRKMPIAILGPMAGVTLVIIAIAIGASMVFSALIRAEKDRDILDNREHVTHRELTYGSRGGVLNRVDDPERRVSCYVTWNGGVCCSPWEK